MAVKSSAGAVGAGDCVVQVYIIDPTGVTMTVRPWKRLGAFGRVALGPGESKAVTLTILEVRLQ